MRRATLFVAEWLNQEESMAKGMSTRSTNKGLTVRINLFAMQQYLSELDSAHARRWIIGQITNLETMDKKMFHDAGELISTLGRWNAVKFRQLKAKQR
jgi:hypothetical protein